MITNLDRSEWVGASDIYTLITSRRERTVNGRKEEYSTWTNFKLEKLGLMESSHVKTIYMTAGDLYEQPILDVFGENVEYSKTIEIPELALRVNLDGNTDKKIIECKTFRLASGGISPSLMKRYYMQVQTQMFAWKYLYGDPIEAEIRSYGLTDEDYYAAYNGYSLPIDPNRIHSKMLPYDEYFIEYKLLPKLKPFAEWLNGAIGREV